METTQKLHISLLFTSFDLHLGQREAGKCGTCLCRHMPNNNAPITLQQNGFGGWLLSVRALRFFLLCWCPLCTGIPPFFPIQFFLETIYCFLRETSSGSPPLSPPHTSCCLNHFLLSTLMVPCVQAQACCTLILLPAFLPFVPHELPLGRSWILFIFLYSVQRWDKAQNRG